MSRNDDTTLVASAFISVKSEFDQRNTLHATVSLVCMVVAVVDCSVSSAYLRSPEPNYPSHSTESVFEPA